MTNNRIISIINMKGGVGKTTITVNLAYTLASEYEKKRSKPGKMSGTVREV